MVPDGVGPVIEEGSAMEDGGLEVVADEFIDVMVDKDVQVVADGDLDVVAYTDLDVLADNDLGARRHSEQDVVPRHSLRELGLRCHSELNPAQGLMLSRVKESTAPTSW